MIVARSLHPGWLSNAYVLGDEAGGVAVFVDSGAPLEPLLAARAEGLARLRLELDHALLELLRLELEPLLRGRHVRDAPLDVLEQLELFLVRVVERLRGVFRAVEGPRRLRPEDQHESLPESHRVASLLVALAK